MVGVIVWIVTAACVGWFASTLMRKGRSGLSGAVVGFLGACPGAVAFGVFANDPTRSNRGMNVLGTATALLGAFALLALDDAVRATRGRSVQKTAEDERKKA